MPLSRLSVQHILLLIAALMLLGRVFDYLPWMADDALISFRYAERLAEGKGLSWTDGEWVEGYSNLLWTLLLAAGAWLGVSLEIWSRVIGALMGVGALAALAHGLPQAHNGLPQARRSWHNAVPMALGLACLSLSTPLAGWIVGALETPLVTVTLAWAVAMILRAHEERLTHPQCLWPRLRMAALAFCGLTLARADGALLVAAVSLSSLVLFGWRTGWRYVLMLAVPPFLCWCAQMGFRILYHDAYMPNTAAVKLHPSWKHFRDGVDYFSNALYAARPMVALATIGGLLAGLGNGHAARRLIFLLIPALVWFAHIAPLGGDNYGGSRHVVEIIVLLSFAVAEAARVIMAGLSFKRQAVMALLIGGSYALTQWRSNDADYFDTPAIKNLLHSRFQGQELQAAFADKTILVALDEAGTVPHAAPRLNFLDMIGLNDRVIPLKQHAHFGYLRSSHETGDGEYVWARRPDLMIPCGHDSNGRLCFISAQEVMARPEAREAYRLVRFAHQRHFNHLSPLMWDRAPDPEGEWIMSYYAHLYSPKIGLQRTPDGGWIVPAWMIAHPKTGGHAVFRQDRFVLRLKPGEKAEIANIRLHGAPCWDAEVELDRPEGGLRDLSLVQLDGMVSIQMINDHAPTELRAIRLRPRTRNCD